MIPSGRFRPVRAVLRRSGLILGGAAVAVSLVAGCASTPPPLPDAPASALPSAWLDVLNAMPCPDPFRSRVRLRMEIPGRQAVQLDGDLKLAPSELLKLDGRVGVFRPVFNLIALSDSTELLIHDEQAYWITARDAPDWKRMNPSAWTRAVEWALCPQALLRELDPSGPGEIEDATWRIEGTLRGTPYAAEVVVGLGDRAVRQLRVREGGDAIVEAKLGGYRYYGEAWMPTVAVLTLPHPEGLLTLTASLSGPGPLEASAWEIEILRPPGWVRVESASVPLPESPSD